MATALFQCSDKYIATRLKSRLCSAPVHLVAFDVFDNIPFISFSGDYVKMYWWCMDLADKLHGKVSFIGIDERVNRVDENIKMCIWFCGSMTPDKSRRLAAQTERLSHLIEDCIDFLTHL